MVFQHNLISVELSSRSNNAYITVETLGHAQLSSTQESVNVTFG